MPSQPHTELLGPQDRGTQRPTRPSAPLLPALQPFGSGGAPFALWCQVEDPGQVLSPCCWEGPGEAWTVCPLGPARSRSRKSTHRGRGLSVLREEAGELALGWRAGQGRNPQVLAWLRFTWAVFSGKSPSVGKHKDETCVF